jgi:hypothetical protein
MANSEAHEEQSIYQIKVILIDSEPEIWRRLRLSGDTSLEDLHHIIQTAMDWDNSHLHQFIVGDTYYGMQEDSELETKDESTITLSQAAPQPEDWFIYEYDFGDSWEHGVLVEEVLPPEEGVHYPVCVEGEYAAPPEDCGGIPGYYMMLEAIEDEEHPDHEEMLEWVGGDYDPVTFDLDRITRELETLR